VLLPILKASSGVTIRKSEYNAKSMTGVMDFEDIFLVFSFFEFAGV
jgi:hypothetical protein